MSSELTPILIGFPIEGEFERNITELNLQLDDRRIDFTEVVPHVTLWMGFVKTKQLESLNLGLDKVFQNITVELRACELSEFESNFGKVWSLNLTLTRELHLLQNRIHHFFEPFRETTNRHEGMDSNTINYINNFVMKSMENYDPHITVGFGKLIHSALMIDDLIKLHDPKMFLLGNYCTCKTQIQLRRS